MARICHWCGIALRWLQWKHCSQCRVALTYNLPSPPFGHMSRKWMS